MPVPEGQIIAPEQGQSQPPTHDQPASPQSDGQSPPTPSAQQPQSDPTKPMDQQAIITELQGLSPHSHQYIRDLMLQAYQTGRMETDQQQPASPPKQKEPDPENAILEQFSGRVDKIISESGEMPATVKNTLKNLAKQIYLEATRTSTGIANINTEKAVAEQLQHVQQWRYEQAIKEFVANNPSISEDMDLLKPLIEAEVPNGPNTIKVVDQIVNRRVAKIKQELETRTRQDRDAYGGWIEPSTRGRVAPPNADRAKLENQMDEAQSKGDVATYDRLLERWQETKSSI